MYIAVFPQMSYANCVVLRTNQNNLYSQVTVTTTTDSKSSSPVDGDLVATIIARLRPVIVQVKYYSLIKTHLVV